MKVRGIKINYILNLTRTVLSTLFGLITMPFINKTLGVDSVGKFEYINSIISYFVLFSALGIPMYGVREIAKVRDSVRDRSNITAELLIILFFTSIVSYLIIFGVLINLRDLQNYRVLVFVLSPTIFLTNIGIEWFFQAVEDQLYITIRSIIVRFITLIMLFTLINGPDDYIIYAVIMLISTVGSNVFNIIYLRKYIDFKGIKIRIANVKRHFKGIFTIFLATVSVSIYLQLDNTLLGVFGGDEHVGIYATSSKLVRFGILFITTLGAVMLPRLSYLYENNQIDEYNGYLKKSFSFILIFSVPLCVMFFVLADKIILFMAGEEFLKAIIPMKILSLLLIIVSLAYFLAFMVLYPKGEERLYTKVVFCSAIVSIVLNVFLIPIYFEVAAAAVNVVVELLGVIIMIFYTRRDLEQVGVFSKKNLTYLVGGLIVFFGVLMFSKIQLPVFLSIVLSAVFGLSLYITYLIIMKDEFIIVIFNKIKNKLYKV